jgi:hypothetical protein
VEGPQVVERNARKRRKEGRDVDVRDVELVASKRIVSSLFALVSVETVES